MGRRAKGKGRARERKVEGRGRKEEEVIVEEENWWKVTRILVGLWERDLREVREWEGEGGEFDASCSESSSRPDITLTLVTRRESTTDVSLPAPHGWLK